MVITRLLWQEGREKTLMNRKMTFLAALSLAGGLSLAACNERTSTDNTATARATASPAKMSNSDLETRIKASLNENEQLRAADLGVDADVDKREITLKGTVESEALRTQAVQIAKNSYAGAVVTDKIDVKPREISRTDYNEQKASEERARAKDRGETVGSSVDDAYIHTKIVAKLMGNSKTPERKINVDVNNAQVTLRGEVENAEAKAEAERVAKDTDGVKRVVNRLKVGAS
jgi:osmotically-inducible protein OsmY